MLDLRTLEHVLAIADCGSLVKAADRLGLTQPALSKSIARLEKALGLRLFERHARGVVPTEGGRLLASRGRLVTNELARIAEELAALRDGTAGSIALGAGPGLLTGLIARATMALARDHPELRLKVITDHNDTLRQALLRGEIDFYLSMVPRLERERELAFEPLYSERLELVCRKGHPLLGRPGITLPMLLDYPWIMPGGEELGRRLVEGSFLAAGLPPPDVLAESNNRSYIIAALEQSDALSVLTAPGSGDIGMRNLAALTVPEAVLTRTVGLVTRRNRPLPAAGQRLVAKLRSLLAEDAKG